LSRFHSTDVLVRPTWRCCSSPPASACTCPSAATALSAAYCSARFGVRLEPWGADAPL